MSSLAKSILAISLISLLAVDFFFAWVGRRREKSARQAWIFIFLYAGFAVLAGFFIPIWIDGFSREAYFTTWATEYTLSLDNLLVFFLLFRKLAIPRKKQEILLLIGISGSFLLRSSALVLGVVLVDRAKIFFGIFGLLLIFTSYKIFRENEKPWDEGMIFRRFLRMRFPPSLLTVILIITADLLFAVDSIPAAVGISTDLPLMLTATFFAIMGLRHLYFVLAEAVTKIEYLGKGLAIVLLFLGVKLLLETCSAYKIEKVLFVQLPVLSPRDTTIDIFLILLGATCLSTIKNRISRLKN